MSLSLTFQKEYKELYIHDFAGIEARGNLSPLVLAESEQ